MQSHVCYLDVVLPFIFLEKRKNKKRVAGVEKDGLLDQPSRYHPLYIKKNSKMHVPHDHSLTYKYLFVEPSTAKRPPNQRIRRIRTEKNNLQTIYEAILLISDVYKTPRE